MPNISNVFIHVNVLFLCGTVMYLAMPGSSLFSWHPTCMTLSFILCMSEAIILLSPVKSAGSYSAYRQSIDRHKNLQLTAVIIGLLGIIAIVKNKIDYDAYHLTTYHACFGFVAFLLATMQVLSGSTLVNNLVITPFNLLSQWQLKVLHSTLGLGCYLTGITTIFLAFYSSWFTGVTSLIIWRVLSCSLLALSITVLLHVIARFARFFQRVNQK